MNLIPMILAAAAVLLVATLCLWPALKNHKGANFLFANIAEGVHECSRTLLADAAQTTRYLLVAQGTDGNHFAVCGVADIPIGVCTDEPAAAEDPADIAFLNATNKTVRMVASEAITKDEAVFTAASGKVQDEPATAGTYYLVGYARSAAAADGDVIEVEPCVPIKLVVLALFGNVNAEIGALTIGGTYSQAEVTALRDKTEELADDVRAIQTALASSALLKVLAA